MPEHDDTAALAAAAAEFDWSPAANPIDEAVLAAFWRDMDAAMVSTIAHVYALRLRLQTAGPQRFSVAGDAALLRSFLDTPGGIPPSFSLPWRDASRYMRDIFTDHFVDTTPALAATVLTFFGTVGLNDGSIDDRAARLFGAMHARHGRPSLLAVEGLLQRRGLPPSGIARNLIETTYWGTQVTSLWPADQVRAAVERHADAIAGLMLTDCQENYNYKRIRLYDSLRALPCWPGPVVDALMTLALGTSKIERQRAQKVLASVPGSAPRFVAALADSQADTRAFAAQYLATQREASALHPLEKAVAKEKSDVAKAALLNALEALGQPIDKYFDRATFAKDAAKTLAKGLPDDIDWFPWDELPPVHWESDGAPVDADVMRWLAVQAVRRKSPEPNAILRRIARMFEPREREALGQFLLEAWLRQDVVPGYPKRALAQAGLLVAAQQERLRAEPEKWVGHPTSRLSADDLLMYYLRRGFPEPAGSAAASKGLLAVAAACAGERAVPTAKAYIDEWYGTRPSQGKSLIAMLAWIDHPTATQLLFAIGRRFRTRSFQDEALAHAQALAERRGWTLGDLADRTIPTGGFDDAGLLALSYGDRAFTARLRPDFKIDLVDGAGQSLAALPEPRRGDDDAAAAESKKALASAKKEVKTVAALQSDRLHEAFCTQRTWRFADWQAYLLGHPVVRHLVQRLVWNQVDADGHVARTFRPLDDGTLTSRDDEPVQVPADAWVRLVHDSNLPAPEVDAWRRHLADYKVQPLFEQLGKGHFELPPALATASALTDVEGHLIETHTLRSRASKLGYARGDNDDGAYFSTYEKRFPTLGLRAIIEFSGSELPETKNRVVALMSLSFAALTDDRRRQRPLGEVAAVLLSECHHDIAQLAASGSGFDAAWQTKITA